VYILFKPVSGKVKPAGFFKMTEIVIFAVYILKLMELKVLNRTDLLFLAKYNER
jgi:hypothetical protein